MTDQLTHDLTLDQKSLSPTPEQQDTSEQNQSPRDTFVKDFLQSTRDIPLSATQHDTLSRILQSIDTTLSDTNSQRDYATSARLLQGVSSSLADKLWTKQLQHTSLHSKLILSATDFVHLLYLRNCKEITYPFFFVSLRLLPFFCVSNFAKRRKLLYRLDFKISF
jgi:hypothetical protein